MQSRRSFLAIAAAVALAGCAPSPVVRTAKPSSSLIPGTQQLSDAATNEQGLATIAAAADERAGAWNLSAAMAAWCRGAAEAHQAHVTTLCRADPFGGVNADNSPVITPASPPAVTVSDRASLITTLANSYGDAADRLSTSLSEAAPGPTAMLWASLYCFARAGAATLAAHPDGAAPGAAPVVGQAVPTVITVGTRADRLSALLSRVDALRFGLETMIGRSADTRTDMKQRRTAVDNMRNELAAQLGGSAAGPAISYELPGDVNDRGAWETIWGELESAVLSGWIALAAASAARSDDRSSAVSGIDAQCLQPATHGIGLAYWPGWI